jgi:Family of unknown function (DUF6492)
MRRAGHPDWKERENPNHPYVVGAWRSQYGTGERARPAREARVKLLTPHGLECATGADMDDLAVLTPTFRDDAALFADLHRSVLANTAPSVVHHVVTPPSDVHLFREYEGPRCTVRTHQDLLPRHWLSVPHASGLAVNLRRPWPPVRGWVVQQIMKLAGTALIDARAVLIVDSDAVLLREAKVDEFTDNGRLWFYRKEDAVTADMHRHVLWHNVARRLLGVPGAAVPPLTDYVSPISVWDPVVVRSLIEHIADSTGRNWVEAVGRQLHVSEFMVYGVFVDQVLGGTVLRDEALCHNYYERVPLGPADAVAFADQMPSNSLGVMISSHSQTHHDVRREVFRRCRQIAASNSFRASLFLAPSLQVLEACPL